MSPKNFIIAIVLGIALAAGIFVATRLDKPAELQTAFAIPVPGELPEFSLLDQNGEAFNAKSFRGQWDLVFFGFTNCPDICPTTMQVLANAKRELQESGFAELPRIVLVSVDPERDSPDLLRQYVGYFGEGHVGVTGDLAELKKLTSALGIYFEKSVADGDSDEQYGVDHSAAVLVINPDGKFAALLSAPHLISNFTHDLPILMGHR